MYLQGLDSSFRPCFRLKFTMTTCSNGHNQPSFHYIKVSAEPKAKHRVYLQLHNQTLLQDQFSHIKKQTDKNVLKNANFPSMCVGAIVYMQSEKREEKTFSCANHLVFFMRQGREFWYSPIRKEMFVLLPFFYCL